MQGTLTWTWQETFMKKAPNFNLTYILVRNFFDAMLEAAQWDYSENLMSQQIITLTVITLSHDHCSLNITSQYSVDAACCDHFKPQVKQLLYNQMKTLPKLPITLNKSTLGLDKTT